MNNELNRASSSNSIFISSRVRAKKMKFDRFRVKFRIEIEFKLEFTTVSTRLEYPLIQIIYIWAILNSDFLKFGSNLGSN